MPTYFVDDAGDNSDGSTWAKAYTSIQSLDTAVTIASGDIIYIGADANCTDAAAALTITGPASGLPCYVISSTVGSGTTVSYSKGTGNQVYATGATSDINWDGSFALFGIKSNAGRDVIFTADSNESFYANDCTAVIGAARFFYITNAASSRCYLQNATVDLTADGTTGRTTSPVYLGGAGYAEINGLSFVNAGYRTGSILSGGALYWGMTVSGADFSGFTNATDCELIALSGLLGMTRLTNCITKSSFTPVVGTFAPSHEVFLTNVGPADDPTYIYKGDYFGTCTGSSSIYRSGGQSVESAATSWLITTSANCGEGAPFYTPWIYGTVDSTGSKTFDIYITHDANTTYNADLTDAEVWIEVEVLGTLDEAQWVLATDRRTITTTAAAQTDDSSTWTDADAGISPSFTYKQKLTVSATVNETGMYRARVGFGAANINSGHYCFVDPKVTVS